MIQHVLKTIKHFESLISLPLFQEEAVQKMQELILASREEVYQQNEAEVRKRWNFEDAVSSTRTQTFVNNELIIIYLH